MNPIKIESKFIKGEDGNLDSWNHNLIGHNFRMAWRTFKEPKREELEEVFECIRKSVENGFSDRKAAEKHYQMYKN